MPTADRRNSPLTRTRATGISTAYIVIALVIPLVAYFGFAAGQKALAIYRLNQEAAQVRAETDALKEENARLLAQVEYLKSDAYVEKIAREQLNLIKAGDKPVVVLAPEGRKVNGDQAQLPVDDIVEKPNWLRWWDFFFGAKR